MKQRRNWLSAWLPGPAVLAVTLVLAVPAFAGDSKGSAAVGASPPPAAAPPMTESQREAARLLRSMTEYLAGLQSFSFAFRDGYDAVQSTGQKIEFGESRRVTVARPDRLRVEEISSDGRRDLAIFDGRHVTALDADENVYAQAPQPGNLDDSLVYFVRQLRMRMPLALLLTTRLPTELPGRVRGIDYVEDTDIVGVRAHHIAGRTDNVDFQFWITEGKRPLPLRVVITYVNSPGQPQFWANFADWNTAPKLAQATFQFTPPKGAKQIPFAVQIPRPGEARGLPAATGEVQP